MVYGSEKQESYRNYLQRKIIKCNQEIENIMSKIEKLDDIIVNQCIDTHGEHNYIQEREDGMYGNIYFVCKNCGIEQ